MCTCIEFVIQVLKQKNAHVFSCWDDNYNNVNILDSQVESYGELAKDNRQIKRNTGINK